MNAVIVIIAFIFVLSIAVTWYQVLCRPEWDLPPLLRSPIAGLLAIGVLAVLLALIFG